MKIYVSNIPYKATEEELENHLQDRGNVISVEIVRRKNGKSTGKAIVEMATVEDGIAVIKAHNDLKFQGRSLVIKFKWMQIIFTVGANALPVWVAWKHLVHSKVLEKEGGLSLPIQVRLVYTENTSPQKDRIVCSCSLPAMLGDAPEKRDTVSRDILTSPGAPEIIHKDIQRYIFGSSSDGLPDDIAHLHVHYTGGTQAMGVETVATIGDNQKINNKEIGFSTSYLNARDSSGRPKITWQHGALVDDARVGIDPDLEFIAKLNGIEIKSAELILDCERREKALEIVKNWDAEINNCIGEQPCFTTLLDSSGSKMFCKNGDPLEYTAYAAFDSVLKEIQSRNPDREYKLYYNVKCAGGATSNFQLDVVAVLGYQIILISCGVSSSRKVIKLKAMEAYHRAKQFGGDEAQAVMLCGLTGDEADVLQDDLKVEIGTDHAHLQVWGRDKWPTDTAPNNLVEAFAEYLSKLHW